MSETKNGGLDQYGTGPFEQQQFGTAGIEGVNCVIIFYITDEFFSVTLLSLFVGVCVQSTRSSPAVCCMNCEQNLLHRVA